MEIHQALAFDDWDQERVVQTEQGESLHGRVRKGPGKNGVCIATSGPGATN